MRYFAALTDAPTSEAQDTVNVQASSLPYHETMPGLRIWSTHALLRIQSGVVTGTLFDEEGFSSLTPSSAASAQLGPSALTRRFFGPLVAFERLPDKMGFSLYRDPSGGLPCYYLRKGPHLYVASDATLLFEASGVRPVISLDGVIAHLRRSEFAECKTCLNLAQVRPGERIILNGAKEARRFIWPERRHFEPSSYANSYEEACEQVRAVVLKSISRQAQGFSRISLCFSGGLDSSIVAAALAQTGVRTQLINFRGPDGKSDETPYARECAQHLGLDLSEEEFDFRDIDVLKPPSPHLPRPGSSYFLPSMHRVLTSLHAPGHAVFSGNCGDSVFCYMHSATPLADQIKAFSGGGRFLRTLNDVCTLTRASAPEVLRLAVATAMRKHYRWPQSDWLLSDVATSPPLTPHPLLAELGNLPPSRLRHLALILRMHNTLETFDPNLTGQTVLPLMAKPIQSLCLSLPGWMWIKGGRDRALARDAFADLLPPAILQRRSKGSPAGFMHAVFRRYGADMVERIRYGHLMAAGIIDKRRIERSLYEIAFRDAHLMRRVFDLAATEAWIDHWKSWRPQDGR